MLIGYTKSRFFTNRKFFFIDAYTNNASTPPHFFAYHLNSSKG